MTMTKVFDKLKDLQEILVKKYELEKKITAAPAELTSQNELLERMKKEFIEKNAEYEAVKERVNKLRLDLDEAIKSRESGEKSMDTISTHREYEALDRQIAEASLREQDIRKDLQKEEKTFDDLKENLKGDEAMIASQEEELNAGKAVLNKSLSKFQGELSELEKKESKLSTNLDQEILFKFQRIIKRNSQGIVAVKNGVCTGCHMILPAQFANEVHKGESILFCPYCSRILFYEEAPEDEQETFFKTDDAESLREESENDDAPEVEEDDGEDAETEETSDENVDEVEDDEEEESDENE